MEPIILDEPLILYDDFSAQEKTDSLWKPLALDGADGSPFVFFDDNAKLSVNQGILEVTIPRFTLRNDKDQSLDNGKSLLLSTSEFGVVTGERLSFSVSMTARGHGTYDNDYHNGVVSFSILDLMSGLVFDWLITEEKAYALHERLTLEPMDDRGFSHLVDNPYLTLDSSAKSNRFEVSFDANAGTVRWSVNDCEQYRVVGTEIPSQLRLGLGIFTLCQLGSEGSTCIKDQGMTGSWSVLEIRRR